MCRCELRSLRHLVNLVQNMVKVLWATGTLDWHSGSVETALLLDGLKRSRNPPATYGQFYRGNNFAMRCQTVGSSLV